jgi:hypothetical protein
MDSAVRLEQPQKPDSESISASVPPLGTDWTPDMVFTLIEDLCLRSGHHECTLAACLGKSEAFDSHYCWDSRMNDLPQTKVRDIWAVDVETEAVRYQSKPDDLGPRNDLQSNSNSGG